MKAIYHTGEQSLEGIHYGDIELKDIQPKEVRVKLKTAGLNHRDIFIPGRRQSEDPAVILGSDGAGIVDEIGAEVTHVKKGDEVILNPALGWGKNTPAAPENFEILGFPSHGTFAEYVNIPEENVIDKPKHLNWEEAGALSLSAMTAYRALFTKGQIKAGSTVLIPGATGGVGIYLIQFAKAAGASVYITSRSEEKANAVRDLGVDKILNSDSDWEKELNGEKVDVVIESVGAATFNKSIKQLKPGASLVVFGSSTGDKVEINIRELFGGQFTIHGTKMASTEEFNEMIAFIDKHEIKPIVHKSYNLENYKEALKQLTEAKMVGKIIFTL